MFKLQKKSKRSNARLGVYKTGHGDIKTPFFMPVATAGTVKLLSAEDMRRLGAQILLSNTYHLMLRPGGKKIKKMGGLHVFMDWDGPILTDSGGYQVFSLSGAKKRSGENLVKMNKDGVEFRSFVDGSRHFLSPELSLEIQADLGVDMAVCLDECVSLPASEARIESSVELTAAWARKTRDHYSKIKSGKPNLHCVIQGGLSENLRYKSLATLLMLENDRFRWGGFNIGGLSVGEGPQEMYKVLKYLIPEIPEDRPRYLMGVGYPENILKAVKSGVDMFDCVIPTREGRHGRLFMRGGKGLKYKTINITGSKFATNKKSVNPKSKIPELRNLSLSYLHYLFKIKEPLGQRLATLNNLEFYLEWMEDIRASIKSGGL